MLQKTPQLHCTAVTAEEDQLPLRETMANNKWLSLTKAKISLHS